MFISCMLLMKFQGTLFCNFLELHIYQQCHLHNWKWESRNRRHFFPSLYSHEMNMYTQSWEKMIIWSWNNFGHADPEFLFHDGVLICHVFICFCIFSLWKNFKNYLQALMLQAQGFKMCPFSVHLVESIISVPRYSLEFIRG